MVRCNLLSYLLAGLCISRVAHGCLMPTRDRGSQTVDAGISVERRLITALDLPRLVLLFSG